MNQEGFHPPQQARSQASLRKVLAAAEHVLVTEGIDKLTVAAVAEQAGLSVGAIYRRFTGKDQLLYAVKDQLIGRLEAGVGEALDAAGQDLAKMVGAYVQAMARTFASHGQAFPELLDNQGTDERDRGLQGLAKIHQAFIDAARSRTGELDRRTCQVIARTIIGSCVHRAATLRFWHDELSWTDWATETTRMALAYLTAPGTS